MLKRFYRLMLNCFCIYTLLYNLRNFYNGKFTVLGIICFILSFVAINLIIKIRIEMYRDYRKFVKLFFNTKELHRERYKMYFSGDLKKIKEYTEAIEEAGQAILLAGDLWAKEDSISYRKQEYAKEIISKTNNL